MLIALVNGTRQSAFPGGKGVCQVCKNAVRAKCGPRNIHHWAHVSLADCDPWGENETDWHREWKGRFPEDCREITYVADDGEIHRADVVTPSGIVVEIQHSPITDQERLSRELFYRNLVWVIDGRGFRGRFEIVHALPAPASDIAKDLVWFKAGRGHNGPNGGMFWRPSGGANPSLDAIHTMATGLEVNLAVLFESL